MEVYEIKYNHIEPSDNLKKLMNRYNENNDFEFFFDGGFKKDHILLSSKNKTFFDDEISTDNTIGLAKVLKVSSDYSSVIMFINKEKIKLRLKKEYPIICIKKRNKKFIIEYRKAYRKYS